MLDFSYGLEAEGEQDAFAAKRGAAKRVWIGQNIEKLGLAVSSRAELGRRKLLPSRAACGFVRIVISHAIEHVGQSAARVALARHEQFLHTVKSV